MTNPVNDFQRISESEMEIMRLIWSLNAQSGGPITSAEVQACLSRQKQWKATTILTFLSRLCEKGLLASEKRGKANFYTPLLSEEEYKGLETRAFLAEVHGGSLRSFIAALANDEGLDSNDLAELKDWFEKQ